MKKLFLLGALVFSSLTFANTSEVKNETKKETFVKAEQ